ncbi:MAG TPA: CPBP family intramembrane glutamic endopeptidase [Candidatus Limnocylindrales bacterium]
MDDFILTLRTLATVGFVLLLVLLRLDAERFGAAEYDERTRDGRAPALLPRLAWYVVGFGLVAAAAVIHPTSSTDLFLSLGDRTGAIVDGLAYGGVGIAQAIAFAGLRYHHLRLPEVRSYPGSVINVIGTAFIDEATFRGLFLGFLIFLGVQATAANAIQALVYVLTTRVAAPGRDRYMLVLVLVIGLGSGYVTLHTGGIGAAFVGHAVTRLAVFLATGHAGQPAIRGRETEDIARRQETPDGWSVIGARDSSNQDQ